MAYQRATSSCDTFKSWLAGMGLDPLKKYRLLRHPEELAKAAPTFNGIPILDQHVPITVDYPNAQSPLTLRDATYPAIRLPLSRCGERQSWVHIVQFVFIRGWF